MPVGEIFVANAVISAFFLCLTWAGLTWEARIQSRVVREGHSQRPQPDKDAEDDITRDLPPQIPSVVYYARENGIDSFSGADIRACYAEMDEDEPGPSAPRFRRNEQADESQPPSDYDSGANDTSSDNGSKAESDEREPRTDESEDDKKPKRKRRKQNQKEKHRRMKKPYHHKKPPARKEGGHGKNQNQVRNQSQRQSQRQNQKPKRNQNTRPSGLRGGSDHGTGSSLDMFDYDAAQFDSSYDTSRVSEQAPQSMVSMIRSLQDGVDRIIDSIPSPTPKPTPVKPKPVPTKPRPAPGPHGPRPWR